MSFINSGPAIPTIKRRGASLRTLSKTEFFGNAFSEVSLTRNYSSEFQARKTAFEEKYRQDLHEDQPLTPDDDCRMFGQRTVGQRTIDQADGSSKYDWSKTPPMKKST